MTVPNGPHTGNFLFVTHDNKYNLYKPGQVASQSVAETSMFGTVNQFRLPRDKTYDAVTLNSISSPFKTSIEIGATNDNPLLSFVSMVAPSSDFFLWFI